MKRWRSQGCRATLAVALALSSTSAFAMGLALVPGDKAPGMRGHDVAGDRVVVVYRPGTITLLNFWATWCEPCRREMPELQKLYAERGGDGLQVFGIHVGKVTDEDLAKVQTDLGVTYPLMHPDLRYLRDWGGIAAMPTTVLIDGEGKILRRYIGATTEQTAGLIYDTQAALDGRELGPIIVPEQPDVILPTEERPPDKPTSSGG